MSSRALASLQVRNELTEQGHAFARREELLGQLGGFLEDPHERLGLTTAGLLVQHGDKRGVPWVIDHVESRDQQVAMASHGLLVALADDVIERDRRAWRRWWTAHRDDELSAGSGARTRRD